MKARIVVVLSVTLALALPAAAQAGLPKTGNTLIVPAKSLGGVTLGASSKSVVKAWGKTSECVYQCTYEGKNSGEIGSALLESKTTTSTPKVWNVFIAVSQTLVGKTEKPNFSTPLTRFKTSKGIGLSSKLSELKAAYHGLKKTTSLAGGISAYELKGPKESFTSFTLNHGRITEIQVASHPGG
jgi:hypothetical protein